jgi:hypothetical protein
MVDLARAFSETGKTTPLSRGRLPAVVASIAVAATGYLAAEKPRRRRRSDLRWTKLREPGDPNAFTTHRQDRPFGKLPYVIAEQPFHEFNAACCPHVGEPHKPGMRRVLDEDELSEILVHGYKDALLRGAAPHSGRSKISLHLNRVQRILRNDSMRVGEAGPQVFA